eukprot:CAMPEP_0204566122 /NCGR_PEP_ID=MMETSP0661-20131031/35874_1 /ASSEMBLY_ACC=CAM_ASM_000606 /TAXON_ID=109239 /ORGANISM="Alexandrium margalefi, Strain AMGDE01CS-322" /LENGTH=107 /DNA_ID=CAMNT_0051573947 /DNA_START=123 /DNA_END=447 /DNA_ORIENTATION=+
MINGTQSFRSPLSLATRCNTLKEAFPVPTSPKRQKGLRGLVHGVAVQDPVRQHLQEHFVADRLAAQVVSVRKSYYGSPPLGFERQAMAEWRWKGYLISLAADTSTGA